jgi:hypothetical protein
MTDSDKKRIISQPEAFGYAKDSPSDTTQDSYLYDFKQKKLSDSNDEEDTGGIGGQTGEVEFRYKDAMSVKNRDDLLPDSEIRRLLVVHKEIHKARVDKQKATRNERYSQKEGKYVVPTVAQQLGQGGSGGVSPYKKHPISDKAQWSGIDKQVIGIPTLNEADTNPEMKDRLENKLQNKLQNRLQNTPKFNPRPRPPG